MEMTCEIPRKFPFSASGASKATMDPPANDDLFQCLPSSEFLQGLPQKEKVQPQLHQASAADNNCDEDNIFNCAPSTGFSKSQVSHSASFGFSDVRDVSNFTGAENHPEACPEPTSPEAETENFGKASQNSRVTEKSFAKSEEGPSDGKASPASEPPNSTTDLEDSVFLHSSERFDRFAAGIAKVDPLFPIASGADLDATGTELSCHAGSAMLKGKRREEAVLDATGTEMTCQAPRLATAYSGSLPTVETERPASRFLSQPEMEMACDPRKFPSAAAASFLDQSAKADPLSPFESEAGDPIGGLEGLDSLAAEQSYRQGSHCRSPDPSLVDDGVMAAAEPELRSPEPTDVAAMETEESPPRPPAGLADDDSERGPHEAFRPTAPMPSVPSPASFRFPESGDDSAATPTVDVDFVSVADRISGVEVF
jgi:hypothetical protein